MSETTHQPLTLFDPVRPMPAEPPRPPTDAELRAALHHMSAEELRLVAAGLLDRIEGYRAAIDRMAHRAPASDSGTSAEAAASILPVLTRTRARVLATVERLGAACSDEVEHALGARHTTVSARFTEMGALGWIEPAGTTRARSGRKARRWRLTDEGRRVLAEHRPEAPGMAVGL